MSSRASPSISSQVCLADIKLSGPELILSRSDPGRYQVVRAQVDVEPSKPGSMSSRVGSRPG